MGIFVKYCVLVQLTNTTRLRDAYKNFLVMETNNNKTIDADVLREIAEEL